MKTVLQIPDSNRAVLASLGALACLLIFHPRASAGSIDETESTEIYGEVTVELDRRYDTGFQPGESDDTRFHELSIEAGIIGTLNDDLVYELALKAVADRFRSDEDAVAPATEYLELTQAWVEWRSPASERALRVGRQTFADEREWWWDEELDAVRIGAASENEGYFVAIAEQLAPRTTLASDVEPEEKNVLRIIASYNRTLADRHRLDTFFIGQFDHSSAGNGGLIDGESADASDANIVWLGARVNGKMSGGADSHLSYWLDTAWLEGRETLYSVDEEDDAIAAGIRSDLSAWAFDAGAVWKIPGTRSPSFFLSYALGSGDGTGDETRNRNFRQTGLEGNETAFKYYGEYFDPELSNLRVLSTGLIYPLNETNDFVLGYHDYRQHRASEALGGAEIDLELDGTGRDVGEEIDLIWQAEFGESLTLDLVAALFKAGRANGERSGETSGKLWMEVIYEF